MNMKFGELGIGVDVEFVKKNFEIITNWVQKDYKNRNAEITMDNGIMQIWVYDHIAKSGTFIKLTDEDLDIDEVLKKEKEEKERKQYEALKAKFEKEAV